MSYGDEIMASGQARRKWEQTGQKVQIRGLDGRARWSPLWENLHWIAGKHEHGDFAHVVNGPGCRPYLSYPFTRRTGQTYSEWRAMDNIGSLILHIEELTFGRDMLRMLGKFILLEPHIPPQSNPNKNWGWARWQDLADELRGHTLVQVGPPGTRILNGVKHVKTPDFRYGAAVLNNAKLAILPEGGLHHAAAALGIGKPVIVLFGGSPSVKATGYDFHTNIVSPLESTPCGQWMPCPHCERAWKDIDPRVIGNLAKGFC